MVDITNRKLVYDLALQVRREFGPVDILVNNAGIVSGRPILQVPDEMIERTFQVNAIAHFWTLKAFLPAMLERDHGHVVTIASCAGLFGAAGLVDYCSSKFAAVGTHESLRMELLRLGKKNVHSTCICPTFISTGMFEGVTPLVITGMLTPEDVADRIVRAVRRNESLVIIPKIMEIMRVLTVTLGDTIGTQVSHMLGSKAMDTFKPTRSNL